MPIVFAIVIDPVGAGYVASLARPGGNATGFTAFEYSLSGKWLELLKEIAPNLTRIAILRDPATAVGIGQFAVIQAMAPSSFGVELSPIDVRDAGEIERAVAAFARLYPIRIIAGPAKFNPEIAAFRPPQLRERAPERREPRLHRRFALREADQPADPPNWTGLLRARRERPATVAPPRSMMKSRRLIAFPRPRTWHCSGSI